MSSKFIKTYPVKSTSCRIYLSNFLQSYQLHTELNTCNLSIYIDTNGYYIKFHEHESQVHPVVDFLSFLVKLDSKRYPKSDSYEEKSYKKFQWGRKSNPPPPT